MISEKYYGAKKILLLLPFLFFSLLLYGQYQEIDSTRLLSRDLDRISDTLEEPTPAEDDITDDEEYKDEPAVTNTNYFLQKEFQANGGGPDSLQLRKLPDSLIKKLQKDDAFWYVNYVFEEEKKKREREQIPFTETPLFQTILWLIIIAGFVAFVIIYLANNNVRLFRKANKTIDTDRESDIETDNIFEINYQKEIDKAVSNSNYRLAVRLMFLRALKNLSDKKIIEYKPDRTNFDYLLQLHSTKYYDDFFSLARSYEYSWYGQFDIDPDKFPFIKNDFENFDRKLN
jgi:hypothetical protein